MMPSIPYFRARRQKSGRIFYYFECRSNSGQRVERALGSDLQTALLRWQAHIKVPAAKVPRPPPIGWLIHRFAFEHLPLQPAHSQAGTRHDIARLHKFFSSEESRCLAEVTSAASQMYAARTQHLNSLRTEWSLLVFILKWAFDIGYLTHPLAIPSLGVSEKIKVRRCDELSQLIGEFVEKEGSRPDIARRDFELARQKAIAKAAQRKRTDLVLALQKFRWTEWQAAMNSKRGTP
jgi:hypothetical protein